MIPKYESIAADIRRSIEDGALKPGDKLPTVVEFCELYSVSKITVKRAIEQITEEGLVTSRRGSGTYVKDTAGLPNQAFFQGKNDRAQGFSYEHRGEKVTSVVYDFSIVNPPADVATQLGIAEDDFAYHIVRVRQVDEKPIVIEYTYMPLELIPGLKKKDLYGSVYSFIREQCGLKIRASTAPSVPWRQPRKRPSAWTPNPALPCSSSTRLAFWIAATPLSTRFRATSATALSCTT